MINKIKADQTTVRKEEIINTKFEMIHKPISAYHLTSM